MRTEKDIDPGHGATRGCLRVLGPVILLVGIGFMLIGGIGVFSGLAEPLFWCFFIAIPLMFVGIVMCMFGFMGAVARYQSAEIAPVATDTLDYVADEGSDGITKVARAIKNGLSDEEQQEETRCPHCGAENEREARFCGGCGRPLASTCPSCGKANPAGAKFCSECGQQLT